MRRGVRISLTVVFRESRLAPPALTRRRHYRRQRGGMVAVAILCQPVAIAGNALLHAGRAAIAISVAAVTSVRPMCAVPQAMQERAREQE